MESPLRAKNVYSFLLWWPVLTILQQLAVLGMFILVKKMVLVFEDGYVGGLVDTVLAACLVKVGRFLLISGPLIHGMIGVLQLVYMKTTRVLAVVFVTLCCVTMSSVLSVFLSGNGMK